MLPMNLKETQDDLAQELWNLAQVVTIETSLRSLDELIAMESDDWERVIPRVPGVRTFEGDMRHSAIVALVIAMRSSIELQKKLLNQADEHIMQLQRISDSLEELRRDREEEEGG